MPGLNAITLVGEIVREPELKYLQSGLALCKVPLEVVTVSRSDSGAKDYRCLVTLTAFAKAGEAAASLAVGTVVCVTGRLASRAYTGKDGVERTNLEVVANSIEPLDRTNTPAPAKRQDQEPPNEPTELGPDDKF